MYLSIKTILLMGVALAAAVPTTNDATSDATLSQELDASGSSISPDGPTTGDQIEELFGEIRHLIDKIDNSSYLTIERDADGRGVLRYSKGSPILTCEPTMPRDDVVRPPGPDPITGAPPPTLEARQDGPSRKDISKLAYKLNPNTHVVVSKDMLAWSYSVNSGQATEECLKGKPLADAGNLVAREARGCKADCLMKYGPLLGRKCIKKCKE